jgi:L-ascorbate metabolism protein UlaG (beta-lactamase superfamily)
MRSSPHGPALVIWNKAAPASAATGVMSRRRRILVAAGLSGAAGCALVAAGCALSAPRWRGPAGPHFDGKRFRSIEPLDHGFSHFLRWMTHRERGPWRSFTDTPPGSAPPERVDGGRLRVTFVNHSTVLIQMDGLNILTDPVWSRRVSPFSFVGPRRHRPPGIRFSDLPPIDAVLVSHNHYDHMDIATLSRLARAHHPPVFVGLGNTAFLERHGVPRSRDLDWWESAPLAHGVTLTAVPARHFSSRSPFDRDRTLWCGWVVTGPSGSVYFAGDTGWGSHFQMIRDRFPDLRLALLPIGAYRPRWFMAQAHIDPEEAIRAQEILGAKTAVAIHFGTFAQADDGELEPVEALKAALARHPDPKPRFLALDNGEALEAP